MSNALWITRTKPDPRIRLFCFPYSGGGASIYRLWSSKLPPEIDLCPVQLPGRENRFAEPPYTSIAPLVEELGCVLTPYLDLPFAFFGFSMGALISFELTRHLRQLEKRGPQHLLVAAHRAPQLPRSTPTRNNLSEPEFTQALHRLGGTSEAVLKNEELMSIMGPLLRADFSVYDTYLYTDEPPLNCPITVFGGEEDKEVSIQELAPWCEQTLASFDLKILPGNHFFLHSQQDLLLQGIAQALH